MTVGQKRQLVKMLKKDFGVPEGDLIKWLPACCAPEALAEAFRDLHPSSVIKKSRVLELLRLLNGVWKDEEKFRFIKSAHGIRIVSTARIVNLLQPEVVDPYMVFSNDPDLTLPILIRFPSLIESTLTVAGRLFDVKVAQRLEQFRFRPLYGKAWDHVLITNLGDPSLKGLVRRVGAVFAIEYPITYQCSRFHLEAVIVCGGVRSGAVGLGAALIGVHRLASSSLEDRQRMLKLVEPCPSLAQLYAPHVASPNSLNCDSLDPMVDVRCMSLRNDSFHRMVIQHVTLDSDTDCRPVVEQIVKAPQIFIATRHMNDPRWDDKQPGAVAFATSSDSPVFVIFPRSQKGLGALELITLFNCIFQKKLYGFGSGIHSAKTSLAHALLSSWISRFGVLARLTSDRGPQFTSQLWADL